MIRRPWAALCHLDRILCVHRPADDRCAGVTPAIVAVAQRMNDQFALDLIANGTAMTAAGDVAHDCSPIDALAQSTQSIAFEIGGFNGAITFRLRPTVA